jgi:uncharacterized protein
VSVYLDVNVIIPLFAVDLLSDRAEKALRNLDDDLVVSDFCAAEFSSVIARRVRTRDLRAEEARTAFSNFEPGTPDASKSTPSMFLARPA